MYTGRMSTMAMDRKKNKNANIGPSLDHHPGYIRIYIKVPLNNYTVHRGWQPTDQAMIQYL